MSNFTRTYERVTCPGCHREISAYIPHFGDGSGLRVVEHNTVKGPRLGGRVKCGLSGRIIVRDKGKWRLDF
jgi:hypothetical protein